MLAGLKIITVLLTITAPANDADVERRAHARQASQAGDHVGAAREFEFLWARARDPADLFDAASANLAAGRYTQAAEHLRWLLDLPRLPPERRAEAETLLAAARRELVVVTLDVRLVDDKIAPEEIFATYIGADGDRPQVTLSLAGSGRRYTQAIELQPGDWELFIPNDLRSVKVRVRAGHPARVRLEVPPLDNEPGRREFSTVVAGLGSPGLVAGGTLLGIFVPQERAARVRPASACDPNSSSDPLTGCPADRKRHLLLAGTGGGALGWSAGMITGGLLGLLPDYRRRRTAWFSTLALGGAALASGIVVTSIGAHRFNEFRGDPMAGDATARAGNLYLAGTPILGLGAGLLVSSIAGLAAEYCHGFSHGQLQRCASLRGSIRPDAAILTITGSF